MLHRSPGGHRPIKLIKHSPHRHCVNTISYVDGASQCVFCPGHVACKCAPCLDSVHDCLATTALPRCHHDMYNKLGASLRSAPRQDNNSRSMSCQRTANFARGHVRPAQTHTVHKLISGISLQITQPRIWGSAMQTLYAGSSNHTALLCLKIACIPVLRGDLYLEATLTYTPHPPRTM